MIKFNNCILFFLIGFQSLTCSQNNKTEQVYLQLCKIKEVPFVEMGDSVYWDIVEGGLNNIPPLINLLDNSQNTGIHAPYFGRDYSIADLAYRIISTDIIRDVPTYALLEKAGCKIEIDKGFANYWYFLDGNDDNRKKFKAVVQDWFSNNKDNLVWYKTDMHAYTDFNEDTPFKNPAGGYYMLKK